MFCGSKLTHVSFVQSVVPKAPMYVAVLSMKALSFNFAWANAPAPAAISGEPASGKNEVGLAAMPVFVAS